MPPMNSVLSNPKRVPQTTVDCPYYMRFRMLFTGLMNGLQTSARSNITTRLQRMHGKGSPCYSEKEEKARLSKEPSWLSSLGKYS